MNIFQWLFIFGTGVLVMSQVDNELLKKAEAHDVAKSIYTNLEIHFDDCISTSMFHQKFLFDGTYNFINARFKTTVGFAPKFTSNRKFFANLINTVEFKEMLNADTRILQNNLVKKMKFCDSSVLDQNILKNYYFRDPGSKS